MLRNKLCLLLVLCLFVPSALAESPSIISDEMIQTETVNYSKTAVVEMGSLEKTLILGKIERRRKRG